MGKFEGNADEGLAESLYEMSLDGSWQTLGDVHGFGWYALIAEGHDGDRWYVINEDSQGFVTIVAGPMDQIAAETEWDAIGSEYTDWEDDREAD